MGYGIENFIKKAKEVHCNRYDYSNVNYINNHTLISIICPEHGEFKQIPQYHLDGCGCQTCAEISRRNKRRKNNEQFIKQAQEVHGDKYDYSKVEYKNANTKVCIICPEHGEFLMLPGNHLNGQGCKKCRNDSFKKNTETFVKELYKIYGNKYDYSKIEYINSRTKVCIICPEHGEFWKVPGSLINGYSCPYCSNYKMSKEQFIEKARKVHGDKYDYSKVEYKNANDNVCIICPEHGDFWQTPVNHLKYKGCPICKTSHLQKKIRNFLIKNNINFEEEKILPFFKDGKSHKSVDFYLPDYGIAIECQGIQHFEPTNFGGKLSTEEMNSNYKKQIENDRIKKELCDKNGVKLIYYSELEIIFPYNVIKNKKDLLKEILNN